MKCTCLVGEYVNKYVTNIVGESEKDNAKRLIDSSSLVLTINCVPKLSLYKALKVTSLITKLLLSYVAKVGASVKKPYLCYR